MSTVAAVGSSGWQYSHFNQQHWLRVRQARKDLGLPHKGPDEGVIEGHPLVGRKLVDKNGVERTILAVERDWYLGYGVSIYLESSSGSHGRFYVRGNAEWQVREIESFIEFFPACAAEIIALS
ncbi:hypothetical protein ACOTHJ_15015 [Achromobacter xylosoxidans]